MIAEAADLEFALIGMLYRDHGNEEKNLDLKHERSDRRKAIRLASSIVAKMDVSTSCKQVLETPGDPNG